MDCEYCKDPEKAVTILSRALGDQHRVQIIMDASPADAGVAFALVRLPGARTGRARRCVVGFNINYCPMCGRQLRPDDKLIK